LTRDGIPIHAGRITPQAIKARHQDWRERRLRRRVARLNVRYCERHSPVVTSGPFEGLRNPDDMIQIPKLLGTCELELHQAVEHLIARDPAMVVKHRGR
jgi:hypothetical protein